MKQGLCVYLQNVQHFFRKLVVTRKVNSAVCITCSVYIGVATIKYTPFGVTTALFFLLVVTESPSNTIEINNIFMYNLFSPNKLLDGL
jgi:hypothetical protein